MEEELLINGILHQSFTQSTYSPNNTIYKTFKDFFPYPLYFIAAFSLSGKYGPDFYQRQLVSAVAKYAVENAAFPVWFYRTECNENLLFINYSEDFSVLEYIKRIYQYFKERYNCSTFWGISRPSSSLSELIFAKKEALTGLTFSLQNTHPDLTAYTSDLQFPPESSCCFFPETAKQLLIKGLKTGDISLIDFIITILRNENLSVLSLNPEGFIQLNNALVHTLKTLNSSKNYFAEELLQLNQNIAEYQNNPEQYFILLMDLCHTISERLNSQKLSKKNTLILNVQEFIHSNYNNATLNLSGVAQHFHISEGYLSVIFKEASGISFAEYLEKCRIDQSRVLLTTSSQPIQDIAELVGYNSVYSFRRAFKRLLNTSPSQYREQHTKTAP